MRVLHVLNDVTDRGNGIVNTAVDLAMEQSQQGLTVAVASAGGPYEALLARAGVTHLRLDQTRGPLHIAAAASALFRHIGAYRPDVVHAHMRTGLLLAWLCRRVQHFALVGHVHNVHDRESVLMGMADRVIAVSESVAATMAAQSIPIRKIRVVLNRTLGSRRVPPVSEITPANLAHPSIVTVGGMNHRKGIQELIVAFESIAAELPDAELYLVGDGPDRAQFEAQARASRFADRIHFEGYQSEPQAYMHSADVFVLASRRESFGLVLIEAREAGCAIVATDIDGVPEALDGGRAGLLVPPADTHALAAAIHRLLANEKDRDAWKQRAKAGIERFHVSRMAQETTVVYQDLLAARGDRKRASQRISRSGLENLRTRSPKPADGPGSQAARS